MALIDGRRCHWSYPKHQVDEVLRWGDWHSLWREKCQCSSPGDQSDEVILLEADTIWHQSPEGEFANDPVRSIGMRRISVFRRG